MLSKILARTSFGDWKAFLPAEFPLNNLVSLTDARIQLEIFSPLEPTRRAVRAVVELDLKVQQKPGQDEVINLQFAADPLGPFGGYEYRLSTLAITSEMPIGKIAAAVGLDGVTDIFQGEGSLVAQLLDEVHIRDFSVAVDMNDGKYSFADWSINVLVDNFVVIKDALSFSNVSVSVQNSGGLLGCDLTGSIEISRSVLDCAFRLPSKTLPGEFFDMRFSCLSILMISRFDINRKRQWSDAIRLDFGAPPSEFLISPSLRRSPFCEIPYGAFHCWLYY